MNLRKRRRDPLLVDITPLIDVVFLMLIFFMISTSFSVSNTLKLDLPASHATQEHKKANKVNISIDKEGQIYVQDEPVKDGDVRRRILNISKGDPNTQVLLQADGATQHKRVIYVLDTLRELGMGKIGIATVPIE
ncbi:MAG: biopolymer transporter ExbD [Mariprofundaceae bacterium]|nr:biopolymer transporter ExbD [Mariprofundaceae bacterium]